MQLASVIFSVVGICGKYLVAGGGIETPVVVLLDVARFTSSGKYRKELCGYNGSLFWSIVLSFVVRITLVNITYIKLGLASAARVIGPVETL